MKSRWLLLLFVLGTCFAQYKVALPGYHYSFPRDYFDHPEYETEWWYYTGNLRAQDGHRFGFELTFFRQAVDREHPRKSPWAVEDLYLAHFAVSDLSGKKFWHKERLNRRGPGLAGIDERAGAVWNGNWQVRIDENEQKVAAVDEDHSIQLSLHSDKPPVIHGKDGVSQKTQGVGRASHYISLTRLLSRGAITVSGKTYQVEGTSWMDHEFFSASMSEDLSGWDWLAIQLDDNSELMLYRLRRKDGSVEPFSSGTYVSPSGASQFLSLSDFDMRPTGDNWYSNTTHATYPLGWQVNIPKLGLALSVRTPLTDQELAGKGQYDPSYWEGAIDIHGKHGNSSIGGVGYLELTGYAQPLTLSH